MKRRSILPDVLVGAVLVVVRPAANLAGLVSDYTLNLLAKYLSLAILAIGMNLAWGYTGILSLGQAVFFGLGAYSLGMTMLMESSGKGVYGEHIPDFMVWNQVTELPFFWRPYAHFSFALASAILAPMLVALALGLVTFRRRVAGVYFSILTQALAFAAWLMFNRNEMKLGGTNGLTDFKTLLGFSLSEARTQRWLYLITALSVAGALALCRWLIGSKMGLVLTAVRDQERRLEFLGYPLASYKIFVFCLAAALSGLAGALYVPQVGIITPSQVGVLPSLEIVVWVAVGGRGTIFGPLLGAVGTNAARSLLTARYPEWWPIILGGLFVAMVLLFEEGLMGLPRQARWGYRQLAARLRAAGPKHEPAGS
jgi:urea transport system permease protein